MKRSSNQPIYHSCEIVKNGGNGAASMVLQPEMETEKELRAVSKIVTALYAIFMELPSKTIPNFDNELIEVRGSIRSLEKELELATDRKSIKAVRKRYSLDYREVHDAKQNLTPDQAQTCINICCDKFRSDVEVFKTKLLLDKRLTPSISEGRESESEDELENVGSSKWRDRVGSSPTSPTYSRDPLRSNSKGASDDHGNTK